MNAACVRMARDIRTGHLEAFDAVVSVEMPNDGQPYVLRARVSLGNLDLRCLLIDERQVCCGQSIWRWTCAIEEELEKLTCDRQT